MRAEQVTEAVTYHGEGPVWSPTWGGLRFVDMLAGDVLTLLPDGGVRRMRVGEVAAFVRPRSAGGYVVGVERGIGLADDVDAPPTRVVELLAGQDARMNEGGCDPAGNLWAGSMRYDRRDGGGRLFRVDPALGVEVAIDAVTIANGIAFTPDGTRAYFDDTTARRTDVFDVVEGRLTRRRTFHETTDGFPDGLTLDAAGNVWVAMFGGGRVRRLAPDGGVTDVLLPVRQVTACAFGGEDLRDLYVTTSREDLDDPEPEAGALFRIRTEVPGLPVLPYAG